ALCQGLLYPTNSKKLLNSSNGGVEEFTKNPLYKVQGCDAKRSGPLEIIAEIGGVQRRVVIDTGAEINVIARDFVWQNAWKKLVEEQKEEILGISNQVIIADGKLVLDVTIDGATIPVEFLVVPITNVYAILGIEFIRKYDVQLIFKSDDSQMKWRPNKDKKLRKNRSDPPVQGERLMTYPAPIHPFDPDWHYPDCAAPVGEDNDCRHCIPFRILDYDIQEALEQLRKEKHDKHYNGFSAKKARKISWDELEDEYYNPGKNGELMDLDKEEKVVDSMDVDPKPTNSIIVQNNGVQVTLEWDDKGIKFEGNEHPWFMIKYWQNKIKRKTKSPIRIRSWQGPYASCWCILEDKSHKNLDDNQECNR
ncbi:3312_t:CDS:2, partial [Paraglomus brasilianum]